MFCGTDEKVTLFSFPTDNDECVKWIRGFPNIINNVTKFMGVQ